MKTLWGSMMVLAGLFLMVCGRRKSNLLPYRLLVARSRILWGENVHRFHQVAGAMVIGFGILVALG